MARAVAAELVLLAVAQLKHIRRRITKWHDYYLACVVVTEL